MLLYWILANIVTCLPVDVKTNYGTNSSGNNRYNNNVNNNGNSLNNGGGQQNNQNTASGNSGFATVQQQAFQTPPTQEIGMGWKAWNAENLKT
jgi:hypothetical protein